MPSSDKHRKPGVREFLTHSGDSTTETTQNQLRSQKNMVGSNFYAQSLFAQPYENGFQFISLNKGLTHQVTDCGSGLLDEVNKNTTINFDDEEEPFQTDDLETLD